MNLALLFRAFPLLAEADSQWAELLMNRYPELRKAHTKIAYVAAGIVYGDAAPLQLARLQKELLQQSLLNNITRVRQKGSTEVSQMRKRLTALRSASSDELPVPIDDVQLQKTWHESEILFTRDYKTDKSEEQW